MARKRADLLAAALMGLGWVAVMLWSGDRRLFFPYSMHFAVQAACLYGWRWGAGVVALFIGIRIMQDATVPVLAVEVMVAVLVLFIGTALRGDGTTMRRLLASTVASLLALASLAL